MRELGAQLLGVAKGLSRYAKFSSVGVLGGSSMAAQVFSKKKKIACEILVCGSARRLVDGCAGVPTSSCT